MRAGTRRVLQVQELRCRWLLRRLAGVFRADSPRPQLPMVWCAAGSRYFPA